MTMVESTMGAAMEAVTKHAIDATAIRRGVRRVSHAIGSDGACRSIRLEPDPDSPGRTIILATDGHRLCMAKVTVQIGEARTIPIPMTGQIPRTSREIDALLESSELPSGPLQFPNWRRAVPKAYDWQWRIERKVLLATLLPLKAAVRADLVGQRAEWKAKGEELKVAGKSRTEHWKSRPTARLQLRVHAHGDAIGLTTSKFPCTEQKVAAVDSGGDMQDFGINLSYLSQALSIARSSTLIIEGRGPLEPVMVRDGDDYEIIMPMSL